MRSEKAWYWLTAGVLALGINGAYQDGQLAWMHSLADRAVGMVAQASERSLHFVTMAELMFGRTPENFNRAEAAIQRIQTKVVCDRVARAQQRIAMAQVRQQLMEAGLQRKLDHAQMKMDRVRAIAIDRANQFRDCPGFSKVVVDLSDMPKIDMSNQPDVDIDVPQVDVTVRDHSNGPI